MRLLFISCLNLKLRFLINKSLFFFLLYTLFLFTFPEIKNKKPYRQFHYFNKLQKCVSKKLQYENVWWFCLQLCVYIYAYIIYIPMKIKRQTFIIEKNPLQNI